MGVIWVFELGSVKTKWLTQWLFIGDWVVL